MSRLANSLRPPCSRTKQIAVMCFLTFCSCLFTTVLVWETHFGFSTENKPVSVFDTRNLTEEQFYRRQDFKVNDFSHQIILAPVHQAVCYSDTKTLLLIHSHPSHVDKRQAIRRTWANPIQHPDVVTWPGNETCCRGMRLFFVLGSGKNFDAAIRDEQSRHDDIIQGDFVDTRHNLVLKSLLGLKIAKELCPSAKYLLKSQDSMFINMPLLLEVLAPLETKRSIYGRVKKRDPVLRDNTHLLRITKQDFSFENYPPYTAGSAYVITADIIAQLLETSDYVPYVHAEDVYVTGILGRVLLVKHINLDEKVTFEQPYSEVKTVCDVVQRRLLASRNMEFNEQIILWNQLQTPSAHACK